VIALTILAAMSWFSILKPMEDYKKATMFFEQGQYFEAFSAYKALGDYQDSGAQSLNAYLKYLETDAPENTRLIGYQRLLDNSFPKEAVFASYSKVLNATTDLDVKLKGYRWLESKGYKNAKESMYTLAGEMVSNGRFLDAHVILSSLEDYKDARSKVRELTKKVGFDSQGSDMNPDSLHVIIGEKIAEPLPPTKNDFIFIGWHKDKSLRERWNFSTDTVHNDQVLYAKWFGPIQIGGPGPAGGIVFYDRGFYSDGWRYLEAAPAKYESKYSVWEGYNNTIRETGTAKGTGLSNTKKIVARFYNINGAATHCDKLEVTKEGIIYDDWFLPSRDELDLMYRNLHRNNIGGFSGNLYWSSSEDSAQSAWAKNFSYGAQNSSQSKNRTNRVRPVRAF
jgi:uncharacterized repeat protein (TIGR02543 family)